MTGAKQHQTPVDLSPIPPEAVFVDRLTIREYDPHDGYDGLVISGSWERKDQLGEPTGEETFESMTVPGSFDTKCRLRVIGAERRMTWNPSRFDREDNAVGIGIEDAINQSHAILAAFDQEPWRPAHRVESTEGKAETHGAVISQIDIAVLVKFGSAFLAEEWLRQLGRTQLYRSPPRRRGGTVYQGSAAGRGKQLRAYMKGPELIHRTKGESPYRQELADWCTANGVVRIEWMLGGQYLVRHGMRNVTEIAQPQLQQFVEREFGEIMTQTLHGDDYEKLPREVRGTLAMYLMGMLPSDPYAGMSEKTWRRHRNLIKQHVGYDIKHNNIERLNPKPLVLAPALLTVSDMPTFYRHPDRGNVSKDTT